MPSYGTGCWFESSRWSWCGGDELHEYPAEAIKTGARRYGRRWCHLQAETEAELYEFARRLGVKGSWFQNHHKDPRFWHSDLVPSKRSLAVRLGTKEITARGWAQQYLERRQNDGSVDKGADGPTLQDPTPDDDKAADPGPDEKDRPAARERAR